MAGVWTVEPKDKTKTGYAYKTHPIGNVNVLTCHTWSEYYNEVRKHTPESHLRGVNAAIMESVTPDANFVKKIEKQRRVIRLGISKFINLSHWKFSVTGSRYDIGRLISGDPNIALRRVKHNTDRTVRVLFCTEVQLDTNADAIVIRAAALAELLIALDETGIKTELIMGFSTYNSHVKDFYESRVKLKTSNTPLNIGLLKFQLSGTSFLHTLESQIIHHKFKMNMGGNPGMQCPADLVIADGNFQDTGKHFSSPERAIAWTHDMFDKLSKGELIK